MMNSGAPGRLLNVAVAHQRGRLHHGAEQGQEAVGVGSSSESKRKCTAKAQQHMHLDADDAFNENDESERDHSDCDDDQQGKFQQQHHQQQQQQQQHPRCKINRLMQNLACTCTNGRLVMINLSRRGLEWSDAHAIREAMLRNPLLSVLKLAYNDLGDRGAAIVASGFVMPNCIDNINNNSNNFNNNVINNITSNGGKHPSLTVLDLGFNAIGDTGCATIALHALAGNYTLSTLYLSGNNFKQTGAMAVAGAILHGCNLTTLYLDSNSIGQVGVQALARAIAEREALVKRLGIAGQKTMQKMHLGGINMGYEGFVTLSSMLLTNFSIRTLCLSNNGVDDSCMALLAQSLSRNKSLPLEVIQLSFNEISDAGVECFMNAVWGSQTLKELRLDNNIIRDRGAQLAAVVLTSIKLEVIDLSFNKITTIGIKALMKSLSENDSLQYLGLSGIHIDPNASKALSYGLAYNSTLKYLHIDTCQIGYAAQRHVIAGVVSNRMSALRVLTGFPVGTICTTLGLPKPLEGYTNDQCLCFIRLMWKQWRDENNFSCMTLDVQAQTIRRMGPAPPPDVVRASRMAFQLLGPHQASVLQTEDHQKDLSETSPLVRTSDIMLERSDSGTLRVPSIAADDEQCDFEGWKIGAPKKSSRPVHQVDPPPAELAQRDRNLQWLRTHFQSIHQVGQLPFSEADMWQLHQYFFSPLVPYCESEKSGSTRASSPAPSPLPSQTSPIHRDTSHTSQMGRVLSFQTLGDATSIASGSSFSKNSNYSRRRNLGTMEEKEDDVSTSSEEVQPVTKRARNFRPRISFYPRIRAMVENLGNKQTQHQILSLLRQLKFVESVLFEGQNVYGSEIHDSNRATPADLEMIILDLL